MVLVPTWFICAFLLSLTFIMSFIAGLYRVSIKNKSTGEKIINASLYLCVIAPIILTIAIINK